MTKFIKRARRNLQTIEEFFRRKFKLDKKPPTQIHGESVYQPPPYSPPPGGGAEDTDELVKVTAVDTTANYLNTKLNVGSHGTGTIQNPAGNEILVHEFFTTYAEWWRKAGWYHGMPCVIGAQANFAVGGNALYAIPFLSPRDWTYNQIAINVTIPAMGTNAWLGIYADDGATYPGALVLDAGIIPTAFLGVQAIIIAQPLSANTLYWLVMNNDNPVVSVSGQTLDYIVPIMGGSGLMAGASATYYFVPQFFGPLPNPFPVGAVDIIADAPEICLRA